MPLRSLKDFALTEADTKSSGTGRAEGAGPARSSDGRVFGSPSEAPFRETRIGWLVLTIVWAVCGAYLLSCLRRGWWSGDCGALAQMADRVLRGQVPHRDFAELYTGGLTYLNALAFRVFGENFLSLRIPLFILFLGWVPSVYFIARRFTRPLAAGAVTLLAVAWSVPNYPEAMPSWYNLFFATWGTLALLRYTEEEKRRWLWIAGLCGGLSFLAKISGLYFVAAALLFFAFREQASSGRRPESARRGSLEYRLFVSGGLLLFLGSLVAVVSGRPSLANAFRFILPAACLVAIVLWEIWRPAPGANVPQWDRMFTTVTHFFSGMLVPVVPFLFWYASQGALTAWFQGTFILPQVRLGWAAYDGIPLASLVGLLPAFLVVVTACDASTSAWRLVRSPLLLAFLLLASWKSLVAYSFIAFSPPLSIPLLGIAAIFLLRRSRFRDERARQSVFLITSVAVVCSLIQFPYAVELYFAYVSPVVMLSLVALFSTLEVKERKSLWALLIFYLVLAVWFRTPAYLGTMHAKRGQSVVLRPMSLTRAGGLWIRANQADEYQSLIRAVRLHADGPYIYAAPDSPEVYFLGGFLNPTSSLLDFLDHDFLDPVARSGRILQAIRDRGVTVVVLCSTPQFSGPIPAALRTVLDAQFPASETIGEFEIRWRPRAAKTGLVSDATAW
jgi:hypothetical protein